MVNTRSRSHVQHDDQARPLPTPQAAGDGERITSLEAKVAQLIQQNEELHQQRPKLSHLEVNLNGHSEERENQHQPTGGLGHRKEGHSRRQNDNNGDNCRIERNRKLTTTQPSEVDKALVELKMKMSAIEKKEKHKVVVVSKLFAGIETPFTKQVVEYPLPNKFKSLQIVRE